jgi:putative DNA primase/helicase
MNVIFSETLESAFVQAGYTYPSVNGAIFERFSTNGKASDRAGWVMMFPDGTGAVFGDWRTGETYTWQMSRDHQPSHDEIKEIRRKAEAAKKAAELEREQQYAEAAVEAARILGDAEIAENHQYLKSKGIEPNGTYKIGNSLLIPVYGPKGIQSLQSIDQFGNKKFMPGGKMNGGFFTIGQETDQIIICEGFSTGASIHQATGNQVYVAFNAGNLEKVAKHVRSVTDKRIVIAADDDCDSDKNVGLEAAKHASKAIGATYVMPLIDGKPNSVKTDFNDLFVEHGADAVKSCFTTLTTEDSHGYITGDALGNQKRVGWLVKDVLPKKGLCVVWGAPGSGKSFAMLDLALAIARGLPKYHGKRIKNGVVVYIAMEGNLRDRVEAYKRKNGLHDGDLKNILIKHSSVDFRSVESVASEILSIKSALAGRRIAMVVIDTLNRAMAGGNENSSDDMGMVIQGFKMVEDYFKTLVAPIHHCGKDQERGMRGHSSLLGAADAEISINRNGDDPIRTFKVGKQKDGQDHYDLFNFRLGVVELGKTSEWDEDAEPDEVDISCVIEPTEDKPVENRERTRKNQTIFDASMQTVLERTGERSKEDVRAEYYARHPAENSESKRKAFNRDWERWMNVTMKAINSET